VHKQSVAITKLMNIYSKQTITCQHVICIKVLTASLTVSAANAHHPFTTVLSPCEKSFKNNSWIQIHKRVTSKI